MQHAHVGPQGMLQQSNQSMISNKDQAWSTAACMLHMLAQYEQLGLYTIRKHAISQKIQDSQRACRRAISIRMLQQTHSVFFRSTLARHSNARTQMQALKSRTQNLPAGIFARASTLMPRGASDVVLKVRSPSVTSLAEE